MKRKIFFLLESLEISRGERISISFLFLMLVGLSFAIIFIDSEANYSEEHYAEIQTIFEKKSEAIKSERDLILARYEPARDVKTSASVLSGEMSSEVIAASSDTTEEAQVPITGAELININTAPNELLQELPGVGPTYAKRIISWRDRNGRFTDKNQLMEIKGIGEKRLAKIKPLITL